jgi:enolase-phosphatase E1
LHLVGRGANIPTTQYPSAVDTLTTTLNNAAAPILPHLSQYILSFPENVRSPPEVFLNHIKHLTATDSKDPLLKALQGYLWRVGYQSGALRSPLFADVPAALEAWHRRGKTLAIFSSGSVAAQKLFFTYTVVKDESAEQADASAVDLKPLFAGRYFDTTNAGPKSDRESYVKIAEKLGVGVTEVLFLSDNVAGEREPLFTPLFLFLDDLR